MFQLVYCSEAIENIEQNDIDAILETALGFNAENNITGCLLFHNGEFIQLLEGEKDIVLELFNCFGKWQGIN